MRKKQKTPKPLSYGEIAYARLKQAIRDGVFIPGEPIREGRVADWLKISRTPVRDAIRRLQNEGILSYRLHDGVVVSSLDREDVQNLYAVREVLEGAAAAMAARHATDVDLQALRDIVRASTSAKDPEQVAHYNQRFHSLIRQAARNPYLAQTINTFRESLTVLGPPTAALPGRPSEVNKWHVEILAMFEKRDASGAESAMRAHVRSALLRRLELIEHPKAAAPSDIDYLMLPKQNSSKPRNKG